MRRRGMEAALIVAALAFVAACGSPAKPATFHPGGTTAAPRSSPSGTAQPGSSGPGGLVRPPFGHNVHAAMRRDFGRALAKRDVTTESFRGTVRFTHMRAFPDPGHKGAIDVSACYDNSHAVNTRISTGKTVPDRIPAADHYLRYTDILTSGGAGNWHVIGNYPDVFYPQARE